MWLPLDLLEWPPPWTEICEMVHGLDHPWFNQISLHALCIQLVEWRTLSHLSHRIASHNHHMHKHTYAHRPWSFFLKGDYPAPASTSPWPTPPIPPPLLCSQSLDDLHTAPASDDKDPLEMCRLVSQLVASAANCYGNDIAMVMTLQTSTWSYMHRGWASDLMFGMWVRLLQIKP